MRVAVFARTGTALKPMKNLNSLYKRTDGFLMEI